MATAWETRLGGRAAGKAVLTRLRAQSLLSSATFIVSLLCQVQKDMLLTRVDSCRDVACFLIFMLAPGARKAAYSDIQSFQYRLWRDSLRVVAGGESPKLSQNKALAQRTLPSVLPGAELVGLAGEHGECRGDVDR